MYVSFGMPFDLSILDRLKIQYPQARCKYEMKNLIYAAACSKHKSGHRCNQNGEGTKTEGGGARGRLIIMQLLSLGLCIYVLFQSGGSEMPSGKDDSTLCQSFNVGFTL